MKRAFVLVLAVLFIAGTLACEGPDTPGNNQECTNDLVEYPHVIHPMGKADGPFTGPYNDIIIQGDPDLPTHTIIRPRNMDEIGRKLPVLAWGEGGCVKFGRGYAEMMGEVASYGIIVIADGGPKLNDIWGGDSGEISPGGMVVPTGEALITGLKYALEKNNDPCSPLYQKVDTSNLAVSGQSCGGLQAIDAAGDPIVTAAFIMSSGTFPPANGEYGRNTILKNMHTPMIYLNGGPTDISYYNAKADIEVLKKLGNVELYWVNSGIGHMADILTNNGGTFGTCLTDWLRYQFWGEQADMFEGDDCGYCQDDDHATEAFTVNKFNGAK